MKESKLMGTHFIRLLGVTLSIWMLTACSEPSENGPNELTEFLERPPAYTHKMMRSTGENRFSALAYECTICSFDQFAAIDPPEGWSKGPTQLILVSAELRSTPTLDGFPDAVDFVPEIPGDEYKLIARNLDADLVEIGQNGVIAVAQVMRDTVLHFPAGSRVHELTDLEDNTFVLFAYGVDPQDLASPDFQDANALDGFAGPEGWTYATRILDEDLDLDTPDVATVLAIRKELTSTWQKR